MAIPAAKVTRTQAEDKTTLINAFNYFYGDDATDTSKVDFATVFSTKNEIANAKTTDDILELLENMKKELSLLQLASKSQKEDTKNYRQFVNARITYLMDKLQIKENEVSQLLVEEDEAKLKAEQEKKRTQEEAEAKKKEEEKIMAEAAANQKIIEEQKKKEEEEETRKKEEEQKKKKKEEEEETKKKEEEQKKTKKKKEEEEETKKKKEEEETEKKKKLELEEQEEAKKREEEEAKKKIDEKKKEDEKEKKRKDDEARVEEEEKKKASEKKPTGATPVVLKPKAAPEIVPMTQDEKQLRIDQEKSMGPVENLPQVLALRTRMPPQTNTPRVRVNMSMKMTLSDGKSLLPYEGPQPVYALRHTGHFYDATTKETTREWYYVAYLDYGVPGKKLFFADLKDNKMPAKPVQVQVQWTSPYESTVKTLEFEIKDTDEQNLGDIGHYVMRVKEGDKETDDMASVFLDKLPFTLAADGKRTSGNMFEMRRLMIRTFRKPPAAKEMKTAMLGEFVNMGQKSDEITESADESSEDEQPTPVAKVNPPPEPSTQKSVVPKIVVDDDDSWLDWK